MNVLKDQDMDGVSGEGYLPWCGPDPGARA